MTGSLVLSRIDELTEKAKQLSDDDSQNNRTKSDAYLELSEYLFSFGCYKLAAYYFEMAFKLRRDYIHDELNAKICILAGLCQLRSGSLIQAERFFGYALAAAKQSKSSDYVCISTINMAVVFLLQGHVDEAISSGTTALEEAASCYDTKSQEYLDIIRAMLSVYIQSGHYENALQLIKKTDFGAIESLLLQAGCYMAMEQHDKAKSSLIIAHGQYHSDLRIKEAKTPGDTMAGGLEAVVEDEDEEDEDNEAPIPERLPSQDLTPRRKAPPSRGRLPSILLWVDDGNASQTESYDGEGFAADTYAKWDFGKQKEYSCRHHVMPALVNYNLSILYGMKGEFEKQKEHINEAVDIMKEAVDQLETGKYVMLISAMVINVEPVMKCADAANVVVLQGSSGITKDTVFPSVDTLVSTFIAHSHFQAARSEDLFNHGPLLSSLQVQMGAAIDSDTTKTEEWLLFKHILGEINSTISSWSDDHQLQNMLKVFRHNVAIKEKRRQEEKEAESKEDPNMSKLKNMKSKLKNLSRRAKSMNEQDKAEDKPGAANASEMLKAEALEEERKQRAEMEAKALEENLDCVNSDLQLASGSASSLLHIANFGLEDKDKIEIENGVISDTYKSIASAFKAKSSSDASKSKKKQNALKSESDIATHASIKQEMMPICRASHVEGVTDADAIISEALALCHGLGYGVLGMSGEPEWEENSARTGRRAESGSRGMKAYHEELLEAKKKLQTLENSLVPRKSDTQKNAKLKGNEGTLFSLYAALSVLASTLGQKKDAGLFVNKFNNLAEKLQHPHYQAIGSRMAIDYEEWIQSSSDTYFSDKSNIKLKKLQTVLLNIKRCFGFAATCKEADPELYFDAYKKLINCYCDISSLPKDGSIEIRNEEEDSMELMKRQLETLNELSPQEIDDFESTDHDWIYEYSRARARQCQTRMMEEMKSMIASSVSTLEGLGVIEPVSDRAICNIED